MVHKNPDIVNSNVHVYLEIANFIQASPWILFTFSVATVEQLKELLYVSVEVPLCYCFNGLQC